MLILYTDRQDGEWIPWPTPLTVSEIKLIIDGRAVFDMDNPVSACRVPYLNHIHQDLFFPITDALPIFHSILLPTAARWDAEDRQWTFFICSDDFKAWWEKYVAYYKPGRESQEYFWLDQGPGWSQHGLRAAKEALEKAIATGGPIPDLTRGLFSERQEFGFKPRS